MTMNQVQSSTSLQTSARSIHRRDEIEGQLRRQYLERLDQKICTMRRLYHQRQWRQLQGECQQLKKSAIQHGLDRLSLLAEVAESQMNLQSQGPSLHPRQQPGLTLNLPKESQNALDILIREVNELIIRELPDSSNYYLSQGSNKTRNN